MEKNPTSYKNAMDPAQTGLDLMDLLHLCLNKWHWFVVSVLVCIVLATAYLLHKEPVYTRLATIVLKDDRKGSSLSSGIEELSNMGFMTSNTNANNEMCILKSPDIAKQVIERLDLQMQYKINGSFRDKSVYGKTQPIIVKFLDLNDNIDVSLDVALRQGEKLNVNNVKLKGQKLDFAQEVALHDTLSTPAGPMVILPGEAWSDTTLLVHVTHLPIKSAINLYSACLNVKLTDRDADLLDLTYNDVNTQRAEDILLTHINVYNEDWIQDKNQVAISTSKFINDRLNIIVGDLGNVDENISSFKSQNLLPDIQAAASMYMAQANEAKVLVKELNNQLYMARYIRGYLANETNKHQMLPANSGLANVALSSQITEYNKQLMERNTLVANSSTKNPLVVRLDANLAQMRDALITSIDNEMVALTEQIRSQQSFGGQATSQIASNPKQAQYLLTVERQQKVKESLYLYLLQKREENELNQAFTAYNTRIVTMPSGSDVPTSPVKLNILFIALFLGLAFPVGILYLKEGLNTKVRGRKDLERISIPFVGEIPLMKLPRRPFQKGNKHATNQIFVKQGKRDIINESFRVLRTNVEFMAQDDSKLNVWTVTSFNPGSGKSFIVMNLASCLAIKGKRVLVVDADMRHASSSQYIGSPKPGLSSYLSGKATLDEIVYEMPGDGIFNVIPVGVLPPNPAELLASDALKELIERLRTQYDYVLFDTPPVEIVADTQIIEQMTDRTIFVVRAGVMDKSMLPELQEIYQNKKYKNLCLILNGTDVTNNRNGSRYGYYYHDNASTSV